ncbi:MAG: signal peptidase I [Saprospiraceae bacterium]|nr:signal peptidase I [Saprospiraceae bacterium]
MLVFLLLGFIIYSIGMYFVFPKAGVEAWKGLVPGLNLAEMAALVGRKKSHAWWMLFPIVNIFIFAALIVDLARSFGKHGYWDSVLAVVFAPFYSLYIGLDKKLKYQGPVLVQELEFMNKLHEARAKNDTKTISKMQASNPYKKGALREWAESIVFAVFAAAFIRMFLIEAYMIPTSSMEGSLKVGDFLFVSKAHYGIRLPMTFVMIPLLHNQIPYLGTESYLKKPSFKYTRLPKLQSVKRYEPFVFNWPVGDSVYLAPDRAFTVDQYRREPYVKQAVQNGKLITRPVDKKDHYIKRCVAVPGDSLKIINRQLYINNQPAFNPEHMQFMYRIISPQNQLNQRKLDELGLNLTEAMPQMGIYFLDSLQKAKIQGMDSSIIIQVVPQEVRPMFPYDTPISKGWTVDNYGPIYIPKAGTTTTLDLETLPLYNRVIAVYENNKLEVKDGKIYINGEESNSYTFKQDYYWAMGDNRHNSEDSRAWGYVPADHVVGKPLFIWFSTKNGKIANGINWNRLFTSANKK